jgi:hypothetical protein
MQKDAISFLLSKTSQERKLVAPSKQSILDLILPPNSEEQHFDIVADAKLSKSIGTQIEHDLITLTNFAKTIEDLQEVKVFLFLV